MTETKNVDKDARPCLISCGILRKEIEKLVGEGSLDVDPYFLDEGLHMDYNRLERALTGALERHHKDVERVVVVYGVFCLGFNNEMRGLMGKDGVVKGDGLNYIDCLVGGKGKIVEVDSKHRYLFLNSAWIKFSFSDRLKMGSREEARKLFSALTGIILLDSLGDLNDYKEKIEDFSDYTGLPILERREVGLGGLKGVLIKAINGLNGRKCL